MTNAYSEAITLALLGRALHVKTPEFIEDQYWPHWADYHHAWGLMGLGKVEGARTTLDQMLE